MPIYRATSQNPTTTIAAQPPGNLAASLLDSMYQTIWNVLNDSSNGYATLATDTGVLNNYILTNNSPALAYRQGMFQAFFTANANTGPAQINVDGLGNVSITTSAGAALSGGELSATGVNTLIYDGTKFRLISGSTTLQSFSGFILVPAVQIYTMDLSVAPVRGYQIVRFDAVLGTGTATVSINRNGTAITGASGLALSSTLSTTILTQSCNQNDKIDLNVTAVSASAANLAFSMRVQF